MDNFSDFLSKNNLLIITEVNRFYLSDFRSSLGYLFIIKGKKILYVDGRYIEAARDGVNPDVTVRLLGKLSDTADEIKKEFGISEIITEADISVRESERIKQIFEDTKVRPSVELSDMLINLRSYKTEREIEHILKAQSFAEKAFENILNFIRPGVTEREIAIELEHKMLLAGAEGMSFHTIAVSGVNTSKPHGVPTDKKVENGDFVTMDFGAVSGGYCSDMTRTVAVGYATDDMIEVYETVLAAQDSAIKILKAGVSGREADAAARNVIEAAGYGKYFTHSTGHGVGLEIHEAPNLSYLNEGKLRRGNIVTVEPGIYIEGMFGVRIEDMVKIEENGARNLTDSQKNLIIIK